MSEREPDRAAPVVARREATEGETGQGHQAFAEPPRDKIPAISASHVAAMESSDDDSVWVIAGMGHVLLRTLGRRSGAEHKVALPYWLDGEGRRVVVASFAGAPNHPSWYLNLADKSVNPEVLVRVQGGAFWADAEVLDGEEYERTWSRLVADRAYYDDYKIRTTRRIPLVRLVEVRSA